LVLAAAVLAKAVLLRVTATLAGHPITQGLWCRTVREARALRVAQEVALVVTVILAKAEMAEMARPPLAQGVEPVPTQPSVMAEAEEVVAEIRLALLVTVATALVATLKFGSTGHEHETLCTTKRQHCCERN
jgi:ethanolamine transporter EutH